MDKVINITVCDEDTFWYVSNLILLKSRGKTLFLILQHCGTQYPQIYPMFLKLPLYYTFCKLWHSRLLETTWSPHLIPVVHNNFFWPSRKGRNRTCHGSFRTKRLLLSKTLTTSESISCKLWEAGRVSGGSIFTVSFIAALRPWFWLLNKENGLDGPLVYPRMAILKLPNRLTPEFPCLSFTNLNLSLFSTQRRYLWNSWRLNHLCGYHLFVKYGWDEIVSWSLLKTGTEWHSEAVEPPAYWVGFFANGVHF